MSFKKFGETEKITEVLDEVKTEVISSHIAKTGKSIKDFTDEEREDLNLDLDKPTD